MQARQQRAQSGKGAGTSGTPLAFQLSSPSKLAKRNVLDTRAPIVDNKLAGTAEDNAAASGKARPKKSRWGPDQPSGSAALPAAASGKAWPPASGFKGVNSHRPPGAFLPAKPATSSGVATATHTNPQERLHIENALQQSSAISNGGDSQSTAVKQPGAGQHRRSRSPEHHQHSRHSSQSRDRASRTPGSTRHMAPGSGRYSRSPSQERSRPSSREHSRPPTRNGVLLKEQDKPAGRDDGYPRDRARASSKDERDYKDRSRHGDTPNKRLRHNDQHRDHLQPDRGLSHSLNDRDRMQSNREYDDSGHDPTRNHSGARRTSSSDDRRHRGFHSRRRNDSTDKDSDRSRSHTKTPGEGGESGGGGGRKQERQQRQRSPSNEEEGQITDRPSTASPAAEQAIPKMPRRQLDLSPSRPQSRPSITALQDPPPEAHLPVSQQKAQADIQGPAPAAVAAAPSQVSLANPQQQALQRVLQPDQPLDQPANFPADPLSQPAQPLKLTSAAVSLVRPFAGDAAVAASVSRTSAAEALADLQSAGTLSMGSMSPADVPLKPAAKHQAVATRGPAAAAGDPGILAIPVVSTSAAANGNAADKHSRVEARMAVVSSPAARAAEHASIPSAKQDVSHKADRHSPSNRAGRHIPNGTAHRHSPNDKADTRSPSSKAGRHSPVVASNEQHRSCEDRKSVDYQSQSHRPRRRFEEQPLPHRTGPDRKRSQTPDPQGDRYVKRLRNDNWPPAVVPGHAHMQADYHRSRPGPQANHRAVLEAKMEADRLAALRQREMRDSSQSPSPRSSRQPVLPGGGLAARTPSEGRFSVANRDQSMSMSPSPVHRRTPAQPEGGFPSRARGSYTEAELDGWQSDRSLHGRRDMPRGSDRPPPRFDHNEEHQRSRLDVKTWNGGPPHRVSRHRSHEYPHADPHADHRARASRAQTDSEPHSHDRHLPAGRGQDRWHSPSPTPSRGPRIASGASFPDRHAPRVAPDPSQPDRPHRHRMSKSEHESAARARAQKLDRDMDQMMIKLLSAYGKPAEATGDTQVLEAMRESVRVIGDIDDDSEAPPVFIATRQAAVRYGVQLSKRLSSVCDLCVILEEIAMQDLPSWLPDAQQQQLLNMLVPATWLNQDPSFQPQWKLPVGWEPPGCAGDSLRPPAEPLDPRLRDGIHHVSDLQTSTAAVSWMSEEAEAGEVGQDDNRDPRRHGPTPQPAQPLMLPLPLFPFLPGAEELTADSPSTSPEYSQSGGGGAREGPIDQLAPGGFLYEYWDMPHRPPSPAGSWSTSPKREAASEWDLPWRQNSRPDWGQSGHLEPPAAPAHTTNTEQQYTDQLTTTAQPHWPPHLDSAGQEHVLDQGDMYSIQHEPHWQQQQLSDVPPPPTMAPPPEPPAAPPLPHPAHYPDPESGYYHIQLVDHLSHELYGLTSLRDDMRQGKGDALPGTPIVNKADGYWLPLREAWWKPEDLHWAGIDQMLMQGAITTPGAVPSADIMSDDAVDDWLTYTADSYCQQTQARPQLTQQVGTASAAEGKSPSASATSGPAGPSEACMAASDHSRIQPQDEAHALCAVDNDAALGRMSESQDWFDSFDLRAAHQQSVSVGGRHPSSCNSNGGGRGRCWGPPPSLQYPAMLRGELALAVMSGVAGKSLMKEVLDRAIQQQLEEIKQT